MSSFSEIPGWFGKTERVVYDSQVVRADHKARFVEIGCWKGRSSCHMAEKIRSSGKHIEFFCVDTWEGSEEHANESCIQSNTLYDEFCKNTLPFQDVIKSLRLSSIEAAEQFDDQSCDFIFIDAAHDFDNVVADINAWLPKLKENGVLAGHDYCATFPGVIQAVEKVFGNKTRLYGTCWIYSQGNFHLPRTSPREAIRLLRFRIQQYLLRRHFVNATPKRLAA